MTVVDVATVKVRPHPRIDEGEAEAYNCIAHYEHPRERETWVSIGAAATPEGARADLLALLEEAGLVAPIDLVECHDPETRRRLIWSTKQRAMKQGVALVVVEE